MIDTLWGLGLGAAVFFGTHLVPAVPGVRAGLIARLGGNGYRGLFSLLSLGGLAWMILAYIHAPYVGLWFPPEWTRYVPIAAMPFVLVLVVLTHASATAVKAITRHPMLWYVLLWGLAHLPPNGDAASVILFGGFALFALLDMPLADARVRREDPERWRTLAAETSLVPFGAALAGRARPSLQALGWWKIALGLVAYVALLFAHEHIFGVAPLP